MLNLKVVWRSAFEKLYFVGINILLILLNFWTGMSHAPVKTEEKLDKRFQLALDAVVAWRCPHLDGGAGGGGGGAQPTRAASVAPGHDITGVR
jgi:hypothetical protein